jgi:hypothetical protein
LSFDAPFDALNSRAVLEETMSAIGNRIPSFIRMHWFVAAAAAVASADFTAISTDNWSNPNLLEAGLLFDLSVVIPVLYLWCYRARGKAAILRALALSCSGIWVAGHVVPNEYHHILSLVGFVRYIGLAVLLVVEIKLAVMIYRAIFRGEGDAEMAASKAAEDAGLPAWVARLMALEASLWRKAWHAVKRLFNRS